MGKPRLLPALVLSSVTAASLSVPFPIVKAEGLPTGEVIPRVVCQIDAQQSYALYLPSGYSTARTWPILYAFDPMARGSAPVETFKDAGEKYGYIVVGSNNSRNGPVAPEIEAIRAVFTDTQARFSIDKSRLYTTGCSGGAHVAVRMALMLPDRAAGVIGVAGAFPVGREPADTVSFAFFGVAGMRDFNYSEVKFADEKFQGLRLPHHFRVTDGGHSCLRAEVASEALGWMELQAMKSGKRERDDTLLEELLGTRLEEAEAAQLAGNLYQAGREYQRAVEDFRGLLDVASVEAKTTELLASPEFRKAARQEEKRERKRDRMDEDLLQKINALLIAIYRPDFQTTPAERSLGATDPTARPGTGVNAPNFPAAPVPTVSEVDRMIAQLDIPRLRRLVERRRDSDEGIVAERQLGRIMVGALETSGRLVGEKRYAPAVTCMELAAKAAPDRPFILYGLARVQALAGRNSDALKTLEEAVDKGFARIEQLEAEEAFASLCDDARYQEVLEKLRANRAEANVDR